MVLPDVISVGGTNGINAYAALVAPDGTAATISGLPTAPGTIYNVALNKAGIGLIAG